MKSFVFKGTICLLISLSLVSCIEKCKGEPFVFRIRVEVKSKANDTIILQYKKKLADRYGNHEIARFFDVSLGETQFLEYCLPIEPQDIKFEIFNNPKNEVVKILSVLLENNQHQMFIEQEEFYKYFVNNKAATFSKINRDYRNSHFKMDAFLSARDVMRARLRYRLKLRN